jgi:hypothetical protein
MKLEVCVSRPSKNVPNQIVVPTRRGRPGDDWRMNAAVTSFDASEMSSAFAHNRLTAGASSGYCYRDDGGIPAAMTHASRTTGN